MKLEMRTVQTIAAAAMTLAVMVGCASPLKPLAASAAQNTVSVSADIDEENSYISAQDQMYQKDNCYKSNNCNPHSPVLYQTVSHDLQLICHLQIRIHKNC